MHKNSALLSVDAYVPCGAPGFFCPSCECPLQFIGSRVGGRRDVAVNDYYRCPASCGTFEYERKRHRLRLFGDGYASDDADV